MDIARINNILSSAREYLDYGEKYDEYIYFFKSLSTNTYIMKIYEKLIYHKKGCVFLFIMSFIPPDDYWFLHIFYRKNKEKIKDNFPSQYFGDKLDMDYLNREKTIYIHDLIKLFI